ncbi:TonB-dependent receptor [Pelomonas sp. BJYL3]|uniref:TonB-dependent receptor n=1 Tax=Pelomonas sp. BJYL3 TaxID=2976697 RepID=UPI0022B52DAF|nr:TonB-dependent receptor [Pelomonas sp. BJYL3]
MNDLHWSRFSRTALSVAVAIVAAAPALAQNTTAAVGGRVMSPDGKPVAGATVLIVHTDSGSTNTLVTDAEGRYSARGLRAGGPYVITVTKGSDSNQRQGVFLALAETTAIDLTVGPAQNQLAQVTISGSSTKINSATMGSGTNLTGADLAQQFSMQRNLQDYARLDPRIAQTNKENGEISAAGQNNRFNSITVDGVSISDTFGLEANNLPTMKQPVSMDAIDSVQINLSNYDVTQKGYTGANVNAVTKSGTNTFKGTATYAYRDQDLAGRRWNRPPTDTFTRLTPFKEKLYGFTLGGPIIKDKLFFFTAYEEQHNSISSPAFGPAGSTNATAVNITQAQISEAQKIMQDVYKVDAGSLDNVSGLELSVKDVLVKLDWNINDKHRANVRYTKTEQNEPTLPGFSTNQLALSSYWYKERKTIETVMAQLFSDWTEDFSTELKVSNRDYEKATLSDTNLPQINLVWTNGSSRTLNLGTERSRHLNNLKTKTLDAYFAGNLFVGDHEIKGGADLSRNEIYNVFLQDARGNYTFSGNGAPGSATDPLTLLRNGTPTSYSVQLPFPGKSLNDSIANWTLTNIGFFLQDTWKINKKLNITAGIRVDEVKTDDRPVANAAAAQPVIPGNAATNVRQTGGFGLDNTANVDGQKLVQPRLGFNYQLDTVDQRKSQIRGGVGLFQGAAANVWLTNPYQNVGATAVYNCGTGTTPCPTGLRFNPDGSSQPSLTGSPQANVDFVENGLSQPSVWKLNLAWDGQLPWYGLEAGVEWLHTKVKQGLYYQHLNLGTVTAYAPDGREMYWNAAGRSEACWTAGTESVNSSCGSRFKALSNANYNNVLLASSTNKGDGDTLTLQLSQRVNSNLRWSVAYTRTAATEVSPLASSVSSSSWNNRANFNPNEDVAANSQYLIRDRISAAVNFSKAFVGNYKTTLGVFYEGRAGKPYSWVYRNDMNGDGRSRNDLMYIPKGPGSGEVVFRLPGQTVAASGAAAEAAFWDVVNGDKALRNAKGGVVGRNAAFAPWVNNFDLRLSQEVRGITAGGKGVITLDIMNVGNLLNRRWGQVSEAAFPSTRSFVNFAGITPDGKMVYAVATPDPLVTPTDAAGRTRLAQWGMNLTARYEF